MILDTNALSAAADEDDGIVRVLEGAQRVALPVVVLGEFRYGITQSRHRAGYQKWLNGLIADCTVLDIAEETTLHYAAIRVELKRAGKPIPTNDVWIAALCRHHNLSLLSRDRHFDVVSGIRRLDW